MLCVCRCARHGLTTSRRQDLQAYARIFSHWSNAKATHFVFRRSGEKLLQRLGDVGLVSRLAHLR